MRRPTGARVTAGGTTKLATSDDPLTARLGGGALGNSGATGGGPPADGSCPAPDVEEISSAIGSPSRAVTIGHLAKARPDGQRWPGIVRRGRRGGASSAAYRDEYGGRGPPGCRPASRSRPS